MLTDWIDGDREKKRQSHRTIFLDLSEITTGTSGTNDKVKGCAGPITRGRPLFWPSKNLGSVSPRSIREPTTVHPPSFRNLLCRWTRELNSWQQKESRPSTNNWSPVFPGEDQLFVPLRCISIPIFRPFLILPQASSLSSVSFDEPLFSIVPFLGRIHYFCFYLEEPRRHRRVRLIKPDRIVENKIWKVIGDPLAT